MRVRWNAMGENMHTSQLLKEEDVKKKIEMTQIKRQIEILSTFVPDEILNMNMDRLGETLQFVGVLLFADVSGFTSLCEKYNKTGKGGIYSSEDHIRKTVAISRDALMKTISVVCDIFLAHLEGYDCDFLPNSHQGVMTIFYNHFLGVARHKEVITNAQTRLTATLNAYIGAIVEVIYFYGGDVLKFSGDAFLAAWKVGTDVCLFEVIHEVIVCALFIQENLGYFETEVNVQLKVKLAIACGNMSFSVIGDEQSRYYVILGDAVNDVKLAEHCSVSGDVVIAPCAWGHVSEESYDVTYAEDGNVKVWRCLYKPHEAEIKEAYEQKRSFVIKLCEKHIAHRAILHSHKNLDNALSDSKMTEQFVRALPPRQASRRATQAWITSELKPFIIKPVLDQVEEKQPLEYLTEMREVTIQFINIVPSTYNPARLVALLDQAYKIVVHIVSKLLGIVNKVSLFDKDAMMLVLFGLRGIKHEFESQNALKSAFYIRKEIMKLDAVKTVSVGVSNGLVYCGVVGHPLRREYTVIGGSVNKAARIMCAYTQKITCDHQTYKNSKLSSAYFQLQSALRLKGIENAGHIFEYNEDFEAEINLDKSERPIIGRQSEMDLIHMIVNHHKEIGGYNGLCIRGKPKLGKTKVLKQAALASEEEGHTVVTLDLACGAQRPLFCVSAIYKKLFDLKTTLDNPLAKLISNLPRSVWNLLDFLQEETTSLRDSKEQHETIMDIFQKICMIKLNTKNTVLIIDNIHYIDIKSYEILKDSMKKNCIKLICAGNFDEEATWDILFKFSLDENIKVIELEPMQSADLPILICSFLRVDGIPKKLFNLIDKTCEGRPGWIQSCLLRLINTGAIEVKYSRKDSDSLIGKYTFSQPEGRSDDGSQNREKEVYCVIELFDKYNESTEELTLTAISLDLFDSFTPYQQLIIKTASVLGEVFTRTLMIVMLKYPKEHLFASTIKQLFEEDVFDCGCRYIQSGGLFSKKLCCACFMSQDDFDESSKKFDFPKYAFCKILHFKNKSLKAVAYELLPANQKKELHLRITDVIDNQTNACPNCLRDNSANVITTRRFKDVLDMCSDHNVSTEKQQNNLKYTCSTESIKDIIRTGIYKYTSKEEMINDQETSAVTVPVRKIYDPTVCFCLEILTRVYADLVHHSECAGHLAKRVFFMCQYGNIMLTMNETDDAIAILNEASELLMIDYTQQYVISKNFRKFNLAKVHLLLSEAHYKKGNFEVAKNHITLCLRMYDMPLLSMKFKCLNKLLFHKFVIGSNELPLIKRRYKGNLWYHDIGECLNMISHISASMNEWDIAKHAAMRAVKMLSVHNPNIILVCDTYSNAIDLYNHLGDNHTCELLERGITKQLLRNYANSYVHEMYGLVKLLMVFFAQKIMNGHLNASIRLGYRILEINRTIQAIALQYRSIPHLLTVLLWKQRIDDAVQLGTLLLVKGRKYEDRFFVPYYAFCLELIVDASFCLEPFENIKHFAEDYFSARATSTELSAFENKFVLYLECYFQRNKLHLKSNQWRSLHKFGNNTERMHIQLILNLLKYTEVSLQRLLQMQNLDKRYPPSELGKVWSLLEQCNLNSQKWKAFKPRYLHLKAYYMKLKEKSQTCNSFLKMALDEAIKQENKLEESWIILNRNCWDGGFSFNNQVVGNVNWKIAKTYSSLQWSQIMYPLPIN